MNANSRGLVSITGALVVFAATWFLQTAPGFRDDYQRFPRRAYVVMGYPQDGPMPLGWSLSNP